MKIHKAGYSVIVVAFFIFLFIGYAIFYADINKVVQIVIDSSLFILLLLVIRFFREPKRSIQISDNQVIAPADGKVVVIEEIFDDEFLNDKRIQVSVFMSVWNVHINWMPVLGRVIDCVHFNGKYMAAWLPKSSSENERCVTTIETLKAGRIVVKQIAGAVARRIITYAKKDGNITAGDQLGFIRFGSRVDILLPVDSKILVKLDQKVKGGLTSIAELPQ